eukprot:1140914-Pelagomonas_calceolata.AAC.4
MKGHIVWPRVCLTACDVQEPCATHAANHVHASICTLLYSSGMLGLFGDAAVNPLAQSHNSFLLQHDEDGPEDVKPVGPPQKGTRRIQKSGPPTRMSTRGSLREGM